MTTEFGLRKEISNIAYDLHINTHLNGTKAFSEKQISMPVEEHTATIKQFHELKMEDKRESLYYYNILLKAMNQKESSKGQQDSLAGPKGNKGGSSGCKALDEWLDNEEKQKSHHATWEEITEGMTEVEKEIIKRDILDKVKRAAEDTEKSKGDVPARLADILQKQIEIIESTISWRTWLRRFLGSTISTEVRSTRKKPNFRFPEAGSLKYKWKTKGLFLCDSSGSMSDYDMNEINNEMFHAFRAGANIDYASWDAECEPHRKYDGKLQFERTKCGGKNCASSHGNM